MLVRFWGVGMFPFKGLFLDHQVLDQLLVAICYKSLLIVANRDAPRCQDPTLGQSVNELACCLTLRRHVSLLPALEAAKHFRC